MTKDEFFPTLSIKAQNIVQENLKLFHNKSFQVFYSHESRTEIRDNADYYIYIKNDKAEDLEYKFLHEFFHCVQYETGFPLIVYTNFDYRIIATSITSLILDLDIRERLRKNGYYQDIKYIKEAVKLQTNILKMIERCKDEEEMTSLDDIVGIAGIMLTSHTADVKNDKLFLHAKSTRPLTVKYYEKFKSSIELFSYNSAVGVYNIFTYLLEELELKSFMKIESVMPISFSES